MGVRRMSIQTVGNWCSTLEDCHTFELTDKRGNCEQGINYRAEVLKSEVGDCKIYHVGIACVWGRA